MNKTVLAISSLALTMMSGVPALAQQKIGVVQVQSAIVGTKEGQKAANDLEIKMAPKRKELETKQGELRKLQESLQKGGSVMNEQARAQLAREIDTKNVGFKTDQVPGGFEFDTSLPGNSNSGHDSPAYGGGKMTDEQRWDLIEYLKSL